MFFVGLAMFAVSMPVTQAQTSLGQIAPRVVTADELAQHPERYYGLRVSVSGSVEDVYNPSLFTVDDDHLWTASRDVLVLNSRPADRAIADADVAVTGMLVRFSRDEVERRIQDRLASLDRDLLDRFKDKPVIIADSIRTASGVELMSPDPLLDQDWDESVRDMPRVRRDMPMAPVPVDSGELDDHPDRYIGRMVTLRQRVDDVYSRSFFTLRDDIVVVAPELHAAVADNRFVTVTGEVMRFDVANIERRVRGYQVDVLPRQTDQFKDNIAVIASSIRTDDGQELIGR
jgi:hypothetical protein